MSKPRVYITRRVPATGVNLLQEKCDVKIWDSDEPIPRQELLKNVVGVQGIFCLITEKIDAELLNAAGMFSCSNTQPTLYNCFNKYVKILKSFL